MIKSLNTKPFDLQRMLGEPMAYLPVGKSKNENLSNDVIRYNLIDKEYRKAVQSDDWSNYSFVYEVYYNYRLNGGNSYYIKAVVEKYKNQYEKQKFQKTEKATEQEVSKDVSVESVNKEIDDLLNFIESYKQARYNTWKDEFYNGTRLC